MKRRAGLVLVCVLAGALAAACGGGGGGGGSSAAATTGPSKVAVSTWVGSVCTAANTWKTTLEKTPNISNPTDLSATKDAISSYLDSVVNATKTFVASIEAAGVPDTDKGEELSSAFSSAITTLEGAFSQAKSEVDNLSTSDPQAAVSGLQKVGTELTTAANQLSTTFDDLNTKYPAADLSAAAKNNPACKSLTGSS